MRIPALLGFLVVALTVAGLAASPASAATEFGSDCEANESLPGPDTAFEFLGADSEETIPVSGIITRWQLNLPDPSPPVTQRLKVVRELPEGFEVVGESAVEDVADAGQGVATRVPVARGDLLGLASQAEGLSFLCKEESIEGATSVQEDDAPVGATFGPSLFRLGEALPVRVRIEPDADHDGYGDESQDGCPTNAAIQGPCSSPAAPLPPAPAPPAPHPSGTAKAHKGSVSVKASTDVAGPVTVTGTVKLGKGKTTTLNGGSQTLVPGQFGTFTLKFTKRLKKKLAVLPKERNLTLKIAVRAANSAGVAGTQSLTVKLKGQG